jgi:hypothetical protein
MAQPRKRHWRALKRLARYLKGKPITVFEYRWQTESGEIEGYTDSDWAGCRHTSKSTSGGAMMLGQHCVKTWSSTQKSITLSSGEAELVAMVKMSSEVLGLIQLAKDWGQTKIGRVLADSSAALAVVKRKGNGKLRHVRVGMMWIQQTEENGDLQYNKVAGEKNQGDLMTKGLGQVVREKHMAALGQVSRPGRAETALHTTTQNHHPKNQQRNYQPGNQEEEEEYDEIDFINSIQSTPQYPNTYNRGRGHSIGKTQYINHKFHKPKNRGAADAAAAAAPKSGTSSTERPAAAAAAVAAAAPPGRGGVQDSTCICSHFRTKQY